MRSRSEINTLTEGGSRLKSDALATLGGLRPKPANTTIARGSARSAVRAEVFMAVSFGKGHEQSWPTTRRLCFVVLILD